MRIIIIISFIQGIYTHIPETNYVPREYGVAAILLFLSMVLISLVSVLNLSYFYISTFRSMFAVPNIIIIIIMGHSNTAGSMGRGLPYPKSKCYRIEPIRHTVALHTSTMDQSPS